MAIFVNRSKMPQSRRRARKNALVDRLARHHAAGLETAPIERWRHGQVLTPEPMLKAPHQVANGVQSLYATYAIGVPRARLQPGPTAITCCADLSLRRADSVRQWPTAKRDLCLSTSRLSVSVRRALWRPTLIRMAQTIRRGVRRTAGSS